MESLCYAWVLSYFSFFWRSRNKFKKLRFFWSGSGRSREASGPKLTRLGTPKIGPGRVILRIFGVFFLGPVFKSFCHCFFCFFLYCRPWVRIAIYSVLSTFPFFETVKQCEKTRIEQTRQIDGTSMEKPAQNGHPHRGIKQNVVFHFFSLSGRIRGDFGVQPGSVNSRFSEKWGPESLFVFLVFSCRVACSLKWPLEAPGRPQGGPREAPGRPRGGFGDNL